MSDSSIESLLLMFSYWIYLFHVFDDRLVKSQTYSVIDLCKPVMAALTHKFSKMHWYYVIKEYTEQLLVMFLTLYRQSSLKHTWFWSYDTDHISIYAWTVSNMK